MKHPLRIIGGALKNRPLKSPKGLKTRPTLAILRKAVFDIVQATIQETRFLDLFAGSGVMGIEALSRGAAQATFVDKDRQALLCIRENLKLFSLQDKADVFFLDALEALQKCAKKKRQFDIIYVDPPYGLSETTPILQQLLSFIDGNQLLASQGILFIEERAPPTLPHSAPALVSLRYVDARKFSDTILHKYVGL
jgi:16S rRNA (guanine966-N2)-methyltransferase